MGTIRLRLDVSYDGADFSGWAAQPTRRTVAGVLTEAFGRLVGAGTPLGLVVAGRTDAGVHATGQVCHVDVPVGAWAAVPGRSDAPPEAALLRPPPRPRYLPRPGGGVRGTAGARWARRPPPGFDARFSALRRRYAYRLCDD